MLNSYNGHYNIERIKMQYFFLKILQKFKKCNKNLTDIGFYGVSEGKNAVFQTQEVVQAGKIAAPQVVISGFSGEKRRRQLPGKHDTGSGAFLKFINESCHK